MKFSRRLPCEGLAIPCMCVLPECLERYTQ
jgi:hypothetical protein